MITPASLGDHVSPSEFIAQASKAITSADLEALLAKLPIVSEHDYEWDKEDPERGWRAGKFHWIPVGADRGNKGRIALTNNPVNPIAERTINGMEALIEMARQRELRADPHAKAPDSPRDAVKRYFGIVPVDQLPRLGDSVEAKEIRKKARDLARLLRVRLIYNKAGGEFTVSVEDDGLGQVPALVHKTLLSLGTTTKADKWYLIGVFGQGGSSAYSVTKGYSWVLSRRVSDLLDGGTDGAGWTVVRHVFPRGRRDDYYAYLACSPDGKVPFVSASDADKARIPHGTRFVHIGVDFGKGGSAITRQLYQSLNHVLYNPVVPFELYVGSTSAQVYGNAYRLSSLGATKSTTAAVLDKAFPPQTVGVNRAGVQ